MIILKHCMAALLGGALFHAQSAAIPSQLNVNVLEGEGAFNNIKQRLGRNIRIAVKDQNGQPVAGAKVVFTAPLVGPSVMFGKNGNRLETVTDAQGTASTAELTPNSSEGGFGIRVMISSGTIEQTRLIRQSNTAAGGVADPKKGGGGKKALILALIGGGAAAGLALGLLHGDSDEITATSISIGNINVGGPR